MDKNVRKRMKMYENGLKHMKKGRKLIKTDENVGKRMKT